MRVDKRIKNYVVADENQHKQNEIFMRESLAAFMGGDDLKKGKNTPLHHICSRQAAEDSQLEKAKKILGKTSCINARNDFGHTPFSLITRHRYPNLALVKKLLTLGANPDVRVKLTERGWTTPFVNMVALLERLQLELIDSSQRHRPRSLEPGAPKDLRGYTNKLSLLLLCLGADVVKNPNSVTGAAPGCHHPTLFNTYYVERLFYDAFLAGDDTVCRVCLAAKPRLLLDMMNPMRDRLMFFLRSSDVSVKCSGCLLKTICSSISNPPSLSSTCVSRIREQLGGCATKGASLVAGVEDLPLPPLLQKEITLINSVIGEN